MNLREFYITPDYLRRMALRARQWTDDFIAGQIEQFQRTIPDYPEVVELLENELHRRRLNRLGRELRGLPLKELHRRLVSMKQDFAAGRITQDELEVMETEWKIRTGSPLPEEYRPEE